MSRLWKKRVIENERHRRSDPSARSSPGTSATSRLHGPAGDTDCRMRATSSAYLPGVCRRDIAVVAVRCATLAATLGRIVQHCTHLR